MMAPASPVVAGVCLPFAGAIESGLGARADAAARDRCIAVKRERDPFRSSDVVAQH